MKKNVFIAPYQELLTSGQKIINDLGLAGNFECFLGDLTRGIAVARKVEREGADVIVSRGGTAELIIKAGVEVPVVEIPIAFQDLAEALLAAKVTTRKENPKIAIMAFQNMIRSIAVFAKVMDVQLKVYLLKSEEEIFSTIQSVLNDQPDILIGGIHTTEIAAKHGIKTILLSSGEESLRTAFLQAERVSFARQLEKERMRRFRVMIDYSVQGIISIDRNKRIEFVNLAAEKMTGVSLSQVKGTSLASLYPDIPLDTCLQEGKVYRGQFV
ncbi:MAG: proprionate catabolism activator, Fis family [Firmicutes bacterium]|nr:proprionate catabolism activator, Fis family [Bacillota bacterium]